MLFLFLPSPRWPQATRLSRRDRGGEAKQSHHMSFLQDNPPPCVASEIAEVWQFWMNFKIIMLKHPYRYKCQKMMSKRSKASHRRWFFVGVPVFCKKSVWYLQQPPNLPRNGNLMCHTQHLSPHIWYYTRLWASLWLRVLPQSWSIFEEVPDLQTSRKIFTAATPFCISLQTHFWHSVSLRMTTASNRT